MIIKNFIKKTSVIITIMATVFWSMGSAFLLPPLPANATGTDTTVIVSASNGSYNSQQNTTIATSSAAVSIMKIQVYTGAVGKTLTAITLNFSGYNFVPATDLADLATGNTSGVALYNDSAGSPGSAITLTSPVWSGNNITLTPSSAITLTQNAYTSLYVLVKTGANGVNGHQIIATLPAISMATNTGSAGPATYFNANALVINTTVDTTPPTISNIEKISYNTVDVTFSEQIQNSTVATSSFSFSGSPTLTVTGVEQRSPNTFRVTAYGGEILVGTHTLTASATIKDLADNSNTTTSAQPITVNAKIKISEFSTFYSAEDSEFIELYNAGSSSVDINGWMIQYSNPASGASWSPLKTFSTSTVIPAYGFYLLGTATFTPTKDTSFTAAMSSSGGHIRIYIPSSAKEVDKIGWGSAISPEGAVAVATQSGKSLERKAFGSSTADSMKTGGMDVTMGNSWDTDNNSFDFVLQTYPSPQNISSTETPDQIIGSGPMINHMSINTAPTGAPLNVYAQMGDPMTPMDQLTAELHYMIGDGTPTGNLTTDYTTAPGTHQGNGYFQFTIPQVTIDASTSNGIYYYLKLITNSGTKYMSASPSADATGVEATVCQSPFQVTVQSSAGWAMHDITGIVVDQASTPIASALVSLDGTGYSTTTGADGTFTLSSVKDDVYNLKILKTDYYESWFNNLFLSGSNFNIGTSTLSVGTGGGASGDTTKPRINWTGPPDGMQGVPSGQENFKIFFGFSKDMDSSTINNTNIYLTTDGSTIIPSTVSYDNVPDNNSAAGLPPDNYLGIVQAPDTTGFTANTTYYLVMTGNVRDTSGNSLEGNRPEGGHVISFSTGGNYTGSGVGIVFDPNSASSWTAFGTGAMMPPFVMGTNPNDGAQNIVPNIKININFSDPMDATSVSTTGNIKLYKITYSSGSETKTPVTITSALDTSTKIAIVTPSTNLTTGKYRVVATGALKSATGVFMGDPQSAHNISTYEQFQSAFEVGATTVADNTKPTVIATWPDNNATNIQVNPGQLTIQFSEGMSPSSITANTITLKRNTTNITGTVNYDAMAHSATFAPSVVLSPSTSYTLTIAGDATATSSSATDIVGNPLATNKVVVFTTSASGDTTAPQIMFGKGDEYSLAVTFTEAMNSAKITDSNNWKKSVLNPLNYILKYGPTASVVSSGTLVDLTNASFEYDALSNTVKISKIGLTYATGQDYYINMASSTVATITSTGATDLSNNTLATKTSFQFPIESSATTKGMLGPTSGGMTGGMMGPSMTSMGMMKAGVFPMNSMASANTTYFVELPTTKAVASGYKIVLTYPQGFDVSGAKKDTNSPKNNDINNQNTGTIAFGAAAETSGGANNDGVVIDAVARTVTITLAVTGTPPANDYLHLDISGIINSSIPRNFDTSGYSVDIKIMNASGSLSETVSGMPFFITQGGSSSLTGSITLTGATGTTDGTISVYLGSPMTGPVSQDVTITDGSGNYNFTGLSNGQYMLFTDPTITVNSIDWGGISMPEPATVSGVTTKNLTFAKQVAGGGLKQITVNITGAFGTDDIDVFASGPSGFKVKTLTDAGTNPSTTLFLGDGNWMVGFGPAMPKGPMSGPVAMPDWMPPMPIEVKISDAGTVATESSGTANDGTIIFSLSTADMQIIGYAKDDSGSAIADAEVYAYQPQGGNGMGAHTRTDTNGKFTLKISAAGNYTVGINKPGLPQAPNKSVTVKADTSNVATDGNATANIYVDNKLITTSNLFNFIIKKPGYTISGKLSDGTNPVTYAPVWADKSSGFGHADTMTDSSGNYILYVDNGSWSVSGYVPGYGNAEQQTVVIASANATQNLAPSTADTTNRYTVSGTITINGSTQGNLPLRAVEYSSTGTYLGKQYNSSTNSTGVYSLSLPGTGSGASYKYYRIDIWTPDFGEVGLNYDEVASSLANIQISNAATTTANITIAASNLITTTISLNNKSGYSGKEAFLKIEGTTQSGGAWLPTGFNKSLRIGDVAGDDQTIKLTASKNYQFFLDVPGVGKYMPKVDDNTGVDSTTHNVIATTTDRMIIFDLPSATASMFTVSGTVKDGSGAALGNARVWVGNSSGYNNGTETASSTGAFSIQVPTGSTYRMGAMKPGYTSPEPIVLSDTTANTTATKNFVLTASSLTISGQITTAAGVAIPNGWVRAETTDGTKVANSSVDGGGNYSLGVTAGIWRIYGVADGYKETQHTSNITVASSNQTANIKLDANSNWTNTSNLKPIVPANGGTIDDTAANSTGVKLTIPPNALGSSSSNGNITTALTSAVTKTDSTQPFNNSGRRITAVDNSGQAITNLNDYIDMDMVIYKADVAAAVTLQATSTSVIYNNLKTTDLGYWDATLNDWVKLSTTRTAYYKADSNATEWTLYVNQTAGDDFGQFIDTLIAGTTYTDYKLVYSSSTNHLTIFAVILPYIATAAQAAVVSTPAPAASASGGNNQAIATPTTCTTVLYNDWQTTCTNGYQYRNVKSQSPAGCALTTTQENDRKKTCGVKIGEKITEKVSETADSVSKTVKNIGQTIANMAAEATEIIKANINSFLGKFGFKRNIAQESTSAQKYVSNLVKEAGNMTADKQNALNNFITYGTDTTVKLGAGERAGVVNSYKSAFGKLPTTEKEWTDAIKIANGRWPGERSTASETNATAAFKKIYKRDPNRANPKDDAAVTVIAYGLRPANRNLNSEKAAIKSFRAIYGYDPTSATAWDIVRAIAYSGATR